MGPLLVTGAACFGAAVGIGLLTAAAGRSLAQAADPLAVRSLFIVVLAFTEGIGVLGVVVGIQAIVLADVGDSSGAILAAVPAVGGAIAGSLLARQAMLARASHLLLAFPFLVGLGTLGPVVGMLAVLEGSGQTIKSGDGPFVVIALVLVSAAIGHGLSGARGFEALAAAPSAGASGLGTPGTIESIRLRVMRRAMLIQLVAVLAVTADVVLIVLDGRPA